MNGLWVRPAYSWLLRGPELNISAKSLLGFVLKAQTFTSRAPHPDASAL